MGFHEDQNRVHQLFQTHDVNIKMAYGSLKPIQQAAITLSMKQHHSIGEIAQILGLSEPSVITLYKQAFQTLISQMQRVPHNRRIQ